jgi:hypothetical protein
MKGFKIGGIEAHPTKGFRNFARPRKANSKQRRALIFEGALSVKKSHAYNRRQRSGFRWPKMS